MKLIPFCNKIIEYSFYSLFLLVPLIFSGSPSELFEFPKMWLTFGVTILIAASWLTKMILLGQVKIQRTPLDIPILLFLIANIISTIFSLDPHVSLWGYYSRFNGGLLSIISYVFLYYAFVSNFSDAGRGSGQNESNIKHTGLPVEALAKAGPRVVMNLLKVSLFSGLIVALWGIPSHFGIDPTCYVFRGNFDTSCWTEAFKPTIRIFSTLGQPAWLAAYMSVLIPISAAFALINLQGKNLKFEIRNLKFVIPAIFVLLFYAALTYTDTRGGFIGFWVANIIFWGGLFLLSFRAKRSAVEESHATKSTLNRSLHSPIGSVGMTMRYFLIFNLLFLLFNFFQGIPISQLSKFTLPELSKNTQNTTLSATNQTPSGGALGGTDSGKIRLLVWKGAINAWKENPIIGTGVETFAYAYYQYKPTEHNLTSEWDYLYNKAHNEYLNYLTTTGIFGLGGYLLVIGMFLFQVFKYLNSNIEARNSKQIQNTNIKNTKI
jgi:putative inorganic carbon (hco3(-)) transporter